MCIQALPLLLSAAGAGIQQAGANRADSARRRALDESVRRNQTLNNRAGERISQEIQTVAGANPEMERKAAQDDFLAALRKAKVSDGGSDIGAMGATSGRFAADVGQARTAATGEGRALAGNIAAIDAPQYSRVNETRGLTDTATDLSLLGGESRGQDFLTQLRLARAAGAGAGLEAIGGGLNAFGQASAARAVKPKPKPRANFSLHGG